MLLLFSSSPTLKESLGRSAPGPRERVRLNLKSGSVGAGGMAIRPPASIPATCRLVKVRPRTMHVHDRALG